MDPASPNAPDPNKTMELGSGISSGKLSLLLFADPSSKSAEEEKACK